MELEEDVDRRTLAWRVGPFGAVVLVALVLSAISHGGAHPWWWIASAAALFALIPPVIVLVPWSRLGRIAPLVPVAGFCFAVGLLRQATGGGATAYGPLVLLPVAWEALYGTRRELWSTVAMVTATFVVPIVCIGGPAYTSRQWGLAVMFTLTGAVVGTVIQGLVVERTTLVDQLRAQVMHDGLTGLLTRRACEELLDSGATDANGCERWLSFIDLDRFKAFNDEHGHRSGDDLLRDAGRAWRTAIGDHGTLARWGGEEFLLLYDGPLADARQVLVRMAAATPARQTFSAGVVALDRPGRPWTEALAAADLALYRAKRNGRDQVAVADASTTWSLSPA